MSSDFANAPIPEPILEALLRFCEKFIADHVLEAIRLHGVEESGAGQYYVARAHARGQMFPKTERKLLEHVFELTRRGPTFVVHAGSGIGTLSAVLAALGAQVLAVEGNKNRAWGARQLRAAFWELFPKEMTKYEFREGTYPEAVHASDLPAGSKKVLLFTNVGGFWADVLEKSIIDSFAHYDVVYFCTGMFGRSRPPEECEALVARIHRQFPGTLRKMLEERIYNGYYYALERQASDAGG